MILPVQQAGNDSWPLNYLCSANCRCFVVVVVVVEFFDAVQYFNLRHIIHMFSLTLNSLQGFLSTAA